MVDSGANFNQSQNPTHANPPQLQGGSTQNFNLNMININNIFQQSSLLLPNSTLPPKPEEPKKDIPTISTTATAQGVNTQETQKLNNFLNSLGFKLGDAAPDTASQSSKSLQPLPLIARAKDGVYLIEDQEKDYLNDKSKLIWENATASLFSRDGSMLAFASPHAIGVYIFAENRKRIFDLPNVVALDFSPKQRFLTTIDRRENRFFISIFEPDPLRKLYELETVRYKKETWPQLKFTENDELVFWACKPTQIEVLNPRQNFQNIRTIETHPFDFFIISEKIENLKIVCVSLEHSAGYNGHEGRIDVYRYQDLGQQTTPLVSKIIDKAHEVNLFFSPSGQNLLIWAQNFTDKTGQSYYGEHTLYYLDINKKTLKRVPTYKGPIHDVAWNPNGLEFIVISGFMPAGSVLFDSLCTPKFEFGRHHRNTIKWSPLSRFVCLGGFGNLPGDMEIWDVYTWKQVGSCKSQAAVSCRWAPDGRRILTGTLNPRLRVSNNYKVYKYTGELLNFVDYSQSELYEVLWRPAVGKFQDRPASPTKKIEGDKAIERSESEKSEKSEKSDKSEDGEKKVFRPKGGAFAAQLKAAKTAKAGGRMLEPDEIFENEANLEDYVEKKVEDMEKNGEKKEEEPKKVMTKILRRNDRKSGDENKDEDKSSEGEQRKESE